jgi:hypothetical protein
MPDQDFFFTVTYTSNGPMGTEAELVGPGYSNFIPAPNGSFVNVPYGDGYQLTLVYESVQQSVSFNVRGDVTLTVTLPLGADTTGTGDQQAADPSTPGDSFQSTTTVTG